MKYVPRIPIPWDMVVFLAITTAGFGYSVHRLFNDTGLSLESDQTRRIQSISAVSVPTTADLGCLERSLPTQRLDAQSGTIRLRGRFCHLSKRAMQSFDGVQITNLTNGFEGTVVFQGYEASFVSDFVVLVPGRNEIQIEWREKSGAPARRILAEVFEAPRSRSN